MTRGRLLVVLVPVLVLAATPPAHAQRAKAELTCVPAGDRFAYDCTIHLSRGGQPLPGATITVTADMPSMPMAHQVRPVAARPGAAPGEYEARLQLEMFGEWAVRLRLDGPVRDQLILHHDFQEAGASPASPGAHGHRHR